MTWPHRAKETAKGALILVALAAVFLIWVGCSRSFVKRRATDWTRRGSRTLSPDMTPGDPGASTFIGIGPGPPPSQVLEHWEAEAAMKRAGCDVPGE